MKYIKSILAIALTICMAFSLCGCGDDKNNPEEQIILYNIENEPITLDPQIADDNASKLIILNIFEGLMRLDENDRVILGVAEKYDSNDNFTKFTFTLRDNLKWNDGTDLTTDDFQYGIIRALSPDTKSNTVNELYCIKNAEKFHNGEADKSSLGISVTDKSISFELEYPDEDFPRILTLPPTMPCNKEFFISTKGQYGREDDLILSNGPFFVREYGWKHDESIKLRNNQNYIGDKKAVPAGVDISIGSIDNGFQAISDDKVNCYSISGTDLENAKNQNMSIKSYDDTTWGICFNVQSNIMKNDNIRKGFLKALNRQSIEKLVPEHFNIANGIIPKSVEVASQNYRTKAGNMFLAYDENSKQYIYNGMKELGIDRLSNIEILCPDNEEFQPLINELIERWNENTGYYFNKNPVSKAELEYSVSIGDYSIALYPIKSDGSSPYDTLKKFSTNNDGNISGLSSDEFDSYITKLENSSDSESLDTIIKAERFLSDNAIFYPICTETRYFACAENVTGLIFHQFGAEIDFRYATAVPKD